MTLAEVEKLTPEEIDRLVATQVMGWTVKDDEINYYYHASGHYKRHGSEWHPSTDHNDMALVRAEIQKRGLQNDFARRVCDMTNWENRNSSANYWWHLLNATPRQQCHAALLAVQEATK